MRQAQRILSTSASQAKEVLEGSKEQYLTELEDSLHGAKALSVQLKDRIKSLEDELQRAKAEQEFQHMDLDSQASMQKQLADSARKLTGAGSYLGRSSPLSKGMQRSSRWTLAS